MEGDYYDRQLILPGEQESIRGKLTYGLNPTTTDDRLFFLTSFNKKLLSTQERVLWDRFILVHQQFNAEQGSFRHAKSIVLYIRSLSQRPEEYGVAVHSHGPVPVFLTNSWYPFNVHGKLLNARVVFYYSPKFKTSQGPGINTRNPLFLSISDSNNGLLLSTLNECFDVVMRRYFEDVADVLRNVALFASTSAAYTWSKKAEDTIGGSIKAKLEAATPPFEVWSAYIVDRELISNKEILERCNFFLENHKDIFLAKVFGQTVLYLMNVLYKHLSIDDKVAIYSDRIREESDLLDRYLGEGTAKELVGFSDDLQFLAKIKDYVLTKDVDQLEKIDKVGRWQHSLADFARHLTYLEQQEVLGPFGRVFVSYIHDVDSSENLRRQICRFYEDSVLPEVKSLTVSNLPFGAVFADYIKVQIWQADEVLVIVPKTLIRSNGEVANFGWLIKEAHYARMLDKKVTFVVEAGYNEAEFESAMLSEGFIPLVPFNETEKFAYRQENLASEFKATRIKLTFHPEPDNNIIISENGFNRRLHLALPYLGKRAYTNRVKQLIRGYLSQFPNDVLLTIKCLLQLSFDDVHFVNFTIDDASSRLNRNFGALKSLPFVSKASTRVALKKTVEKVHERQLSFERISFCLLLTTENAGRKNTHTSQFVSILSKLFPGVAEPELRLEAFTFLDNGLS